MLGTEGKQMVPQAPKRWENTEMHCLGWKGHEIVIFRNFGVDPGGHWWPFAGNPWFCVCKVIYITLPVLGGPLRRKQTFTSWPHNCLIQHNPFLGVSDTSHVFHVISKWDPVLAPKHVFFGHYGKPSINQTFPYIYIYKDNGYVRDSAVDLSFLVTCMLPIWLAA